MEGYSLLGGGCRADEAAVDDVSINKSHENDF
jgi:hypothetical protein